MRTSLARDAVLDGVFLCTSEFDDLMAASSNEANHISRLHINHEPISNVAVHDPLVSLVRLLNRDKLNVPVRYGKRSKVRT
jgi:hypothetical protein